MVNQFKKLACFLPLLAVAAFSNNAHALKLKVSTDFDETMVRGELLNTTAQGERVNSLDVNGTCNPNHDQKRCPNYRLNPGFDDYIYLDSHQNVMPWTVKNHSHGLYNHFIVDFSTRKDNEFTDRYVIVTSDQLKKVSKYGAIDNEHSMVLRENLINFYKANAKSFIPLDGTISLAEFVKSCDNTASTCPAALNNKFGESFPIITHVGRASDAMNYYVIVVRHNMTSKEEKERVGGYTRKNEDAVLSKDVPDHLRFQVLPVKEY